MISIENPKTSTAFMKMLMWLISIVFFLGCTKTIPAVKIAEERAANLGATHVVWVYDYQIGSAAVAYRCFH